MVIYCLHFHGSRYLLDDIKIHYQWAKMAGTQNIDIYVKYVRNLNIIKKMCLISKPSFKVFYSLYKMRTLVWKNKNNIYLISAPTLSKKYASGFINQNEAVDNNTGGEVLVKIEIM